VEVNLANSRIAVTGATGFVGQRLVQQMLELGARVSVLVLENEIFSFPDDKELTVYRGDLSNQRILDQLVTDCDVIFHLAAYVHKPTVTQDQIDLCYEVNYLGTVNLIEACLARSRNPFFVYFSTVSVYGKVEGIYDEGLECNPITAYGETKLAAENYLLDKIAANELRGCVLRPSSMIGENAPGNLARMVKLIELGVIPIFNGGKNRKSLVYVDNVIEAAKLVSLKSQISNGMILNISNEEPLTMLQIIEIISKALGKKPLIINLPLKPFIVLANIWDKFAGLFPGKLPMLKRSLTVFASEDITGTKKIQEDLGYRSKVSIHEGIIRMAAAYKGID
jgi:nucleoside-diphosphate-sugar epimerase